MKIILNPDKELVAEIKKKKDENDGYCPCALTKTPDTKCMCKEFREMSEEGLCHCGMYMKVKSDDALYGLYLGERNE